MERGKEIAAHGAICGRTKRSKEDPSPCRKTAGWGTAHPGVGPCKLHGGNNPIKHGRYSTIKRESLREAIAEFAADPDPLDILPELAVARALMRDFIERYDEWRDALLAWHETYRETGRPIPGYMYGALQRCLEEYEILLNEQVEVTDGQEKDMADARKFLELLSDPTDGGKPREILDLSDAVRHADTISKMWKRVQDVRSQDAISRKDLMRIITEMGRSVDLRVSDPGERERIRNDWVGIRL